MTQKEPCNDAISRQAAIDAVSNALERVFPEHRDIAEKAMNKLPPVMPQQKMGRWCILKDKYGDVVEAVCSNCDKNGNHKWAFCPYCCQPKIQEVK